MSASASLERLPYGLMRLSTMLNCHLEPLHKLNARLAEESTSLAAALREEALANNGVHNSDKERIKSWLSIATDVANSFEWAAVHDRLKIFRRKLGEIITYRQFLNEILVLRETIESAIEQEFVYRYPNTKAVMLEQWRSDWGRALSAFPSVENDVVAGIDCWALGHPTACVFHMMRVLEAPLGVLAADVDICFDIQVWHTIIDQIERAIEVERGKQRSQEKVERLRFLSEAAKEFRYFKDGWRNYVSHKRVPYDEHQARSVMEHVRQFMIVLSSRLREERVTEAEAGQTPA